MLVAIVVLIYVLGSVGAMTLPLIVAFTSIAVAMLLVTAATSVVSIADFAPQLAVMIALGVGIDYALLIINRFRAERAHGSDVRDATLTSMDTAGRSVLFAGTTVVIALLGMLILGIRFLYGPAIAVGARRSADDDRFADAATRAAQLLGAPDQGPPRCRTSMPSRAAGRG